MANKNPSNQLDTSKVGAYALKGRIELESEVGKGSVFR